MTAQTRDQAICLIHAEASTGTLGKTPIHKPNQHLYQRLETFLQREGLLDDAVTFGTPEDLIHATTSLDRFDLLTALKLWQVEELTTPPTDR